MEFNQFIKSKKQTLTAFFAVFLIIGIIYTLSQPFKYSTTSKLLVIQQGTSGVDPLSVSRTEQYLSTLFAQVISSNSFFNLVLNSDPTIEKDYFSGDTIHQMKTWNKTVSAKSEENSGFIDITVFHPAPEQATKIANAINQILITQNTNYQGVGSLVKVVVIDDPLVSNYPTQPNILINAGIVVGATLVFGFIYIYLFPEEKYDLYLFGRRRKKAKGAGKQDFLHPQSQPPVNARVSEETAGHYPPQGNIRNILR